MDSVDIVFERYEAVRHRMPPSGSTAITTSISSLLDIAHEVDAFVFDAFGVLNVGETPIEGAADRLNQLRRRGVAIRILTNAASYDRDGAVSKFAALGMHVLPDEIVTSRDAALRAVTKGLWGCISAQGDSLNDVPALVRRLGSEASDYVDVEGFLFLSSQNWSNEHQALLTQALHDRPRPLLVANADLVAPRDTGLSIEPGQYGHLLADEGIETIRFFGKPFPEVYEMVEATLQPFDVARIVMCGDTLHTDILGAANRGWRTVLVTEDGLFAGHDTGRFCNRANIHPDWCLSRI